MPHTPREPVFPAPDNVPVANSVPTGRRIAALWFPYWLSEIVMPVDKRMNPYVLAEHQRGTQRLAAVNTAAEACGLHTGMSLADALAGTRSGVDTASRLALQRLELYAEVKRIEARADAAALRRGYAVWEGP